jgi:hypothetical protein
MLRFHIFTRESLAQPADRMPLWESAVDRNCEVFAVVCHCLGIQTDSVSSFRDLTDALISITGTIDHPKWPDRRRMYLLSHSSPGILLFPCHSEEPRTDASQDSIVSRILAPDRSRRNLVVAFGDLDSLVDLYYSISSDPDPILKPLTPSDGVLTRIIPHDDSLADFLINAFDFDRDSSTGFAAGKQRTRFHGMGRSYLTLASFLLEAARAGLKMRSSPGWEDPETPFSISNGSSVIILARIDPPINTRSHFNLARALWDGMHAGGQESVYEFVLGTRNGQDILVVIGDRRIALELTRQIVFRISQM